MDRKSELLPVPYFHTVFTVPDLLNPLFRSNENQMYTILFAAASQTLTVLSLDKKYLGAQIGVTMVLHTWGQNLAFHPHVHCIVPGGGLTPSGLSFVKSRKKFFIPVKVMSKVFKGKFMTMLKEAVKYGKIRFPIPGANESASDSEKENGFSELMNSLYLKSWVVFCKKPFRNPGTVVEYLSRYTHKTAIGNHRLVEMDNESVSLRWKDYRNGNKTQIMRLDAQEFIRRFMMHVLPSGFQRIRYYGLLSNRNRSTKLKTCFKIIKIPIPIKIKLTTKDLLLKVMGLDITVCKHCGGHWATLRSWMPGTS